MIIELKQWTEVGRSNITDCVTIEYGGRQRDRLASVDARSTQYQRYLLDTHPAFTRWRRIAARRVRVPAQRPVRPEVAADSTRRSPPSGAVPGLHGRPSARPRIDSSTRA